MHRRVGRRGWRLVVVGNQAEQLLIVGGCACDGGGLGGAGAGVDDGDGGRCRRSALLQRIEAQQQRLAHLVIVADRVGGRGAVGADGGGRVVVVVAAVDVVAGAVAFGQQVVKVVGLQDDWWGGIEKQEVWRELQHLGETQRRKHSRVKEVIHCVGVCVRARQAELSNGIGIGRTLYTHSLTHSLTLGSRMHVVYPHMSRWISCALVRTLSLAHRALTTLDTLDSQSAPRSGCGGRWGTPGAATNAPSRRRMEECARRNATARDNWHKQERSGKRRGSGRGRRRSTRTHTHTRLCECAAGWLAGLERTARARDREASICVNDSTINNTDTQRPI